MIKIKKPQLGQTVETTLELLGTTIDVTLLPITENERYSIFKPFEKRKQLVNPVSKQMELVTYHDLDDPKFKASAEELLCKVLVDFKGVGDEAGNILDGTVRENKLLLGSIEEEYIEDIPVEDDEGNKAMIRQPRKRNFSAAIFNKAVALSKAVAEVETKN